MDSFKRLQLDHKFSDKAQGGQLFFLSVDCKK
jgi:hypothetical protein